MIHWSWRTRHKLIAAGNAMASEWRLAPVFVAAMDASPFARTEEAMQAPRLQQLPNLSD
jgi:hypothetical protein